MYCKDHHLHDSGQKWSEIKLHTEQQDIECDAWKRLLELVELAATDEREDLNLDVK
jgi:hypothetical protein